jgi:hypothetical protein
MNRGIKGKPFDAIKAKYVSVKTRVRNGKELSDFINCPVGLRQGCNLSPVLFSLLINELYDYFEQN